METKRITRKIVAALVLVLILGVFAMPTKAASYKLNKTKITLEKGKTCTLKLSKVKASKVKWKSSNASVATINKKAKVAAKKPGSAVITATYKKKNYTCYVTVDYPSFTINPNTKGLAYTRSPINTKYTKTYFMVRSYLEKIEANGGGTLYFQKGTYNITNTLYIPSNTKIVLKEGAVLKKGDETGTSGLKPSNSLFQLLEPKLAAKKDAISENEKKRGYEGVHDVSIIGQNNSVIDVNGAKIGFVLGHTKNIRFTGVTMKNMAANGHLIELNSSQNVSIWNCNFDAGTIGQGNQKECINIDADYQDGFNNVWASHDNTYCDQIEIAGCTFSNSMSGLGSHNTPWTGSHTNIIIRNCTFNNMGRYGIHGYTWKNIEMTKNIFNNCSEYDIYLQNSDGLAKVSENTFTHEIILGGISSEENKDSFVNNTLNGVPYDYFYEEENPGGDDTDNPGEDTPDFPDYDDDYIYGNDTYAASYLSEYMTLAKDYEELVKDSTKNL